MPLNFGRSSTIYEIVPPPVVFDFEFIVMQLSNADSLSSSLLQQHSFLLIYISRQTVKIAFATRQKRAELARVDCESSKRKHLC